MRKRTCMARLSCLVCLAQTVRFAACHSAALPLALGLLLQPSVVLQSLEKVCMPSSMNDHFG